MVFSNAEIAEFNSVMQSVEQGMATGKKPQVSSVLMGLQFAAVIPAKNERMWFEDPLGRMLMISAVQKMMNDNSPDMFSVAEKAFLFSILHIGALCEAIDRAGLEVQGFPPPKPMKEEKPWTPPQDEGEWSEQD